MTGLAKGKMAIHLLNNELWFPPVAEAVEDGLLAIGGDLSVERLLLAYRSGIFPWYCEGEPPLWYSPDPRFVLFTQNLKVSKSMRQLLRKDIFELRVDTSFSAVITHCRKTARPGQDGTWITEDIVSGFQRLHELGYAHCAETWQDGQLVGGLYGVRLGNVFFGESMFSLVSNASKYAFIKYARQLQAEGVSLIDCQVYTAHLESLGAAMITRDEFMKLIV